jgi:hypothetical protein
LESKVEELKKQLDMQRSVSDLAARIAKLESDGGTVATSRSPSNGAHRHDG